MGRIVDEETAFQKCNCFQLDSSGDRVFCYSKGIMGMLKKKQNSKCNSIFVKEASKTLKNHQEKFQQLGPVLKKCMKEETDDESQNFYDCLISESEKFKEKSS